MNKRARKFEYKERTFDDMKERTKKSNNKFDRWIKEDYKIYAVRDGINKLRILPPTWEDAKHYGLDVYLHYGIGGGGQGFGSTYLCNYKMRGKECCLDTESREAEARGEKEYADSLKSTRKVLMWVIDRLDEDEGPQLFAMPPKIDRELVSQSCDEDTGSVRFIDHPEKGYDIQFTKEGKGIKTTYSEYKVSWTSTPLSKDIDKVEEWMDFITNNPIPDVLNFYDDDHIKEVFSGHVFKETEDDEEEVNEEEGYTYEEICDMSQKELENMAVELGMSKTKAKGLKSTNLIDFIATKLDLDVPMGEDTEEEETEEGKPEPETAVKSFRERLNKIKK